MPALTPISTHSPSSIMKSGNDAPAHLIPFDEVLQMEIFMKKNEKSLEGLQAYRFEKDKIGMTHIRFYAYVNGARADETIYHFKDDGALSSITNEFDASVFLKSQLFLKFQKAKPYQLAAIKLKIRFLSPLRNSGIKMPGVQGKKI